VADVILEGFSLETDTTVRLEGFNLECNDGTPGAIPTLPVTTISVSNSTGGFFIGEGTGSPGWITRRRRGRR